MIWLTLDMVGSAGGIFMMWREINIEVLDMVVGSFSVSIDCKFKGDVVGWISGVNEPCSTYGTNEF